MSAAAKRLSPRGRGALGMGARPAGGFSLIEVLIATAVVSLTMIALATLLFRSQVSFERQVGQHDVRQSTRLAVREIAVNLRLAGYNIKSAPEVLTDARTDSISFTADIDDGDAATPCTDESDPDAGVELVTYAVSGSEMRRRVQCWTGADWNGPGGQGWITLATDLAGGLVIFRYFDDAGAELTPPSQASLSAADRARVTAVVIGFEVMSIDVNEILTGEAHPSSLLSTRVRLRNITP